LPTTTVQPDSDRADLDEGERLFMLRSAGSCLELQTAFVGQSQSGGGIKAPITGFSAASRRNLFKRMCELGDWSLRPGLAVFVTLTYPGEFPSNGRQVKSHLTTFRKRWERRYGSVEGVWKMEFQRRGAPHFHLALTIPDKVGLRITADGHLEDFSSRADVSEVRSWVANAWFGIVASGDDRHLLAGTQVDKLADEPAAYFAGYAGSTRGSKEYQHEVPEGYADCGRFWGVWTMAPQWQAELVTHREYVELRRTMWGLQRARSNRCRRRRRHARFESGWSRTTGPAMMLHGRLVEWLRPVPGGAAGRNQTRNLEGQASKPEQVIPTSLREAVCVGVEVVTDPAPVAT
jgi:hypothetical protein